jgi:hypothetical protein
VKKINWNAVIGGLFGALLAVMVVAAIFLSNTAEAAERVLHGYGPEGEEILLSYRKDSPQCHPGEMSGEGRWPNGEVRRACWQVILGPRWARVRWRLEGPGGPREYTSVYPLVDLDLQKIKAVEQP